MHEEQQKITKRHSTLNLTFGKQQSRVNFKSQNQLGQLSSRKKQLSQSRKKIEKVKEQQALVKMRVKSQQEANLVEFLNECDMPSETKKIKGVKTSHNKKMKLGEILNRKQEYAVKYFQSINRIHRDPIHYVSEPSHVFDTVQTGKWIVAGFIFNDSLILKGYPQRRKSQKKQIKSSQSPNAKSKNQRQQRLENLRHIADEYGDECKIKKYSYEVVYEKVRKGYEKFVQDKFSWQI